MPKIEVDETQFVNMQTIAGLFDSMQKDPELRDNLFRMVKKVKPEMAIPEIDVADPIRKELAELRKAQQDFLDAQKKAKEDQEIKDRENAFTSSWNKQKNALFDQGYTVEGIERIEGFAKSEGIANLAAAAALYEKQNPATIAASRSKPFDFFEPTSDNSKHYETLMKSRGESAVATDALVASALAEVRNANRTRF